MVKEALLTHMVSQSGRLGLVCAATLEAAYIAAFDNMEWLRINERKWKR